MCCTLREANSCPFQLHHSLIKRSSKLIKLKDMVTDINDIKVQIDAFLHNLHGCNHTCTWPMFLSMHKNKWNISSHKLEPSYDMIQLPASGSRKSEWTAPICFTHSNSRFMEKFNNEHSGLDTPAHLTLASISLH